MDDNTKTVICTLWQEIKKDLFFFGLCGLVVGCLMLAQFNLKGNSIAPKEPWVDALFSDFVAFNAFGFVFLGLLGLGSLLTCFHALKINWLRLERLVAHLEVRLTQFASSIISFTLGLSLFSGVHALVTNTTQGAALVFVITLFDCLILAGFVSAILVARRVPPFERWYVGLGMFTVFWVIIIWLILYGIK